MLAVLLAIGGPAISCELTYAEILKLPAWERDAVALQNGCEALVATVNQNFPAKVVLDFPAKTVVNFPVEEKDSLFASHPTIPIAIKDSAYVHHCDKFQVELQYKSTRIQVNSTLSVLDTAVESPSFNKIVNSIPASYNDQFFIPVDSFLYVFEFTFEGPARIRVIDTTSNRIITTFQIDGYPIEPTIVKNRMYVPHRRAKTISVIDTKTHKVITIIKLNGDPSKLTYFGDFIYVPMSDYVIGDFRNAFDLIGVIDINKNQVVDTIQVGNGDMDVIVVNGRLYVPSFKSKTISVIDTATHKLITTIEIKISSRGIFAVGDYIYALNLESNKPASLNVINTRTNEIIKSILVGKHPENPTIVDDLMYVSSIDPDSNINTIFVINAKTNELVKTLTRNSKDHWKPIVAGNFICIFNLLYGIESFAHTMSVIDRRTNTFVAAMEVDRVERPISIGPYLYIPGLHKVTAIYIGQ